MSVEAPITNKREMYTLFEAGAFGNAGLNFDTTNEAFDWAMRTGGTLAIRFRGRPGGQCFYWLSPSEFLGKAYELFFQGYTDQDLQYSAMMPEGRLVIQGEVQRSPHYWDLTYNTRRSQPMRVGLSNKGGVQHAQGLRAHYLLKMAFQGGDWDNLMELFDQWPNAVIEFSAYEYCIGNRKHSRAVIWEVREY